MVRKVIFRAKSGHPESFLKLPKCFPKRDEKLSKICPKVTIKLPKSSRKNALPKSSPKSDEKFSKSAQQFP